MQLHEFIKQVNITPFDDSIYDGKSIAIVGNSYSVEGTGKGNLVDNHDIVVRCNSCFAPKFPEDIGTKTDVWAVNCCKAMKEPVYDLGDDVKVVCYRDIRSNVKQRQISHFLRRDRVKRFYNSRLFYLSPAVTQQIYFHSVRHLKITKYPTLGFAVLAHILLRSKPFKRISLFGFSFYEDEKAKACHNPQSEKKSILDLCNTYDNIKLYPVRIKDRNGQKRRK